MVIFLIIQSLWSCCWFVKFQFAQVHVPDFKVPPKTYGEKSIVQAYQNASSRCQMAFSCAVKNGLWLCHWMVGLKRCVSGSWESTIWPVLSDEQKNNGNHVPIFSLLIDGATRCGWFASAIHLSSNVAGSCPLKLQVFWERGCYGCGESSYPKCLKGRERFWKSIHT